MTPALFIDGKWRVGEGRTLQTTNPATGQPAWEAPSADGTQMEVAITAADRAQPVWETLSLEKRIGYLQAYARALETHSEKVATVLSEETGKPLWEARTEVASMVAKVAVSIEAHEVRCREFGHGPATTRFRPHGVVAVFGPYNFPGHLPNGHIVPALLAGNTVVFKPSSLTPRTALEMVRMWAAVDLPAGVLNLVPCGREAASQLAFDPRVTGLFFTGSATTGLHFSEKLARTGKILALEMAGNNPLVVHQVADQAAALALTVQSGYITAGQRCTCARRLIVLQDAAGESFLEVLTSAVDRIPVGAPGGDPEPFHGPVISASAAGEVLAAQEKLLSAGARSLVRCESLEAGTGLLKPGLIDVTDVPNRPDEEIFGPLLQVIRVPAFDAALAEANNTAYGLAAGLLSDDPSLWARFRQHARAGIVNWNVPLPGASSRAPFGGIGLSGNHRPSAYFAADYCSYPVASMEKETVSLPAKLLPGMASVLAT